MRTAVEEYMKFPYTIEIVPDEGSYFVKVKELPGCISVGKTKAEALEMIEDAMRGWLEVALEDGMTIPLPEAMQKQKYSGKFPLRLPKSLHAKLAEGAEREGVSLNQYLVTLLSENNSLREVKSMLEKLRQPTNSEPSLEEAILEIQPNCRVSIDRRDAKLLGAL